MTENTHGMEPKMRNTICVDLDGVIQDFRKCRESCDYNKYPDLRFVKREKCPVNPQAKATLEKLSKKYRIVIWTARVEMERKITEEWLRKNGIPYDELYMGKPRAFLYIDDFAVRFTSWDEIEAYIESVQGNKAKNIKSEEYRKIADRVSQAIIDSYGDYIPMEMALDLEDFIFDNLLQIDEER